jgi:predicted ATPase
MARLDRLDMAKEIAQLGATLGREFSYELLHAVSTSDEGSLQQGLRQLVEAELVYQRGLLPHATYLFKHALIQDTAYHSLLKSRRQQLHQRVAQVLVEQFPQTIETQPELVAHHYTEANLVEQAIPYWQKAGQRASQLSAHAEAIAHLTTGLELLKLLPATPERTQQELRLQIALGTPLMATKGSGALDVKRTYDRALELCRQVGETPRLFSVLGGLCAYYGEQAELQTAQELAEQLLRLAQGVRDPLRLVWAHRAVGSILFRLGEWAPARTHLEQSIALYDPQQHRSSGFVYDPGVSCLPVLAHVLWHLGYPDQALKRSHEALTLAQALSHPYSLTFAIALSATLHHYRGERQTVQERVERMLVLSSEQGFPLWLAVGTIWQGWTLTEQGQGEEGIAQMRQGLTAYQATAGALGRPYYLLLLAEACGKVGQTEEGLAVLAEALAVVDESGARCHQPELYRLKGELLLTQEGYRLQAEGWREKTKEAEECFLKAIDIARQQQAKSLELRAVKSLSRLWQQQGKREQARQMLGEIYGWFTEGFDTKDLQEAKALLEELSGEIGPESVTDNHVVVMRGRE